MDLHLIRKESKLYGIFGELWGDKDKLVAVTLEHSYNLKPKLPPGIYTCVRGMHRLPSKDYSFETFEITGVPGHTGILFHAGNCNNDSAGCVLLGSYLGTNCILESRHAFAEFMKLQENVNSFKLEVS